MKSVHFLLLTLVICRLGISQTELERRKVTDDLSMKVPSNFVSMTDEERNQRYVSYRSPIAMFTNIERTVDLGINLTSSNWEADDLTILKDFYKSNLQNLYTKVDFVQDTITTIGQRDFIVFEFESKVYDENSFRQQVISKYTYIQYTIFNDKVLLVHFTAPLRLKSKWQEATREMMQSIRLKN